MTVNFFMLTVIRNSAFVRGVVLLSPGVDPRRRRGSGDGYHCPVEGRLGGYLLPARTPPVQPGLRGGGGERKSAGAP